VGGKEEALHFLRFPAFSCVFLLAFERDSDSGKRERGERPPLVKEFMSTEKFAFSQIHPKTR
jgi:hypothetical protein